MPRPTDAELDADAARIVAAVPRFTPEQVTRIGQVLDSATLPGTAVPPAAHDRSDERPADLVDGAA